MWGDSPWTRSTWRDFPWTLSIWRNSSLGASRAQTALDFGVGAGVFLIALAFVIGFIPSMFEPFAGSGGAELAAADRTATYVTGDLLAASTAGTGVLNTGCTVGFVTQNVSLADDECGDALNSSNVDDDLDELLALDGRNLNVTIHDLDETAATPATISWAGETVRLTREHATRPESDAATATRVVSLDGTQYRLTVRAW